MELWFYGSMVLGFYGCVALWFLGIIFYCMSISCFQEDTDPISKIFKIIFNGSSSFVGASLFEHCHFVGFRKIIFGLCFCNSPDVLIFLKVFWYI